jgi:hypothetical protein
MDEIQGLLDQGLADLPRLFLEGLISKKLRVLGVRSTKELSSKIVTHILSGNSEPFIWNGTGRRKNITITMGEEDLNEMTRQIDDFCEIKLPQLIKGLAASTSAELLKDLTVSWVKEQALQKVEFSEFRDRMEDRWGQPLGQLRMLLNIAREWCEKAHTRELRQKKEKKLDSKNILIRLLVRACQVTYEIICLLENGFADGAMARWRTLHEIGVVAAILSQHGEDIVERYIAHQAIESKRAMDKYMSCCEQLGYKPLSEKAQRKIVKAYEAANARYGKEFGSDYGWASEHLKLKRPTLKDLEEVAGRADMRAHHQMANDNVHAGIKSMFFRLGAFEGYSGLLAGRSNAGLMEPGQNTAHTLTQLAILVCLSENNVDDNLIANVMRKLRDEIPRSFYHADKKLRMDDKKYRKLPKGTDAADEVVPANPTR